MDGSMVKYIFSMSSADELTKWLRVLKCFSKASVAEANQHQTLARAAPEPEAKAVEPVRPLPSVRTDPAGGCSTIGAIDKISTAGSHLQP
jgi:hypothetical protein